MSTSSQREALARHYLDVDQPQQSLSLVDGLLAENPEDPELWELRARALLDLERWTAAIAAARDGLARDSTSITLLDVMALAQAETGDFGAAEQALLAALELAPEEPLLLARYSALLGEAGQSAKAARVLERAERADPESPAVQHARIRLAYLRGDDRAVERESHKLLGDAPEDPVGHVFLGAAAAERGHVDRVAKHYEVASRHDLSDPDFVELAQHARFLQHPLMVPLRPFHRFGPAKIWIAAIAIIFGLKAAGLPRAAFVFLVAYILLCIYSWVVPPLLERRLARR